jgi:transposase
MIPEASQGAAQRPSGRHQHGWRRWCPAVVIAGARPTRRLLVRQLGGTKGRFDVTGASRVGEPAVRGHASTTSGLRSFTCEWLLVDEIQAALAAQTVTVPAEETAGRVIRELAQELDRLADRRDRLAQEIEQIFTGHRQAPVLMSIPGIGARTGARILTEIGDINRFPTPGHLAAYAGLAPVTRQPGSSINGEKRSRRGNHRLKNAMWLSAFCSLHHDRSRDYYARKRSEGKLHNAAITCLARHRCDVIHAMLRSGLSYGDLPGRQDRPPSPKSPSPPKHP